MYPPLDLNGIRFSLVPLELAHVDALTAIGTDASIWQWTPVRISDRADMEAFVREALDEEKRGAGKAYAIVHKESAQLIGSTRFMNRVDAHRRVEIGGTWLAPAWRRSGANTEAKWLMLSEAFDEWGYRRVEFKTHANNARSRAALLAIGAVEEGTFRKHMVQVDGTSRDSTWFSITDDDWPGVRGRFEERLGFWGATRSEARPSG